VVLLYLVARRLCTRWAAAALVVALAAVSPLQIRYAQEARSYALWGALLLAATLVLMRASERGGIGRWSAFAALLAVSLWTQPLSLLLILPFAILVLVPGPDSPAAGWSRGRGARAAAFAPFAAATCAALLAWLPWAWAIAANRGAASQTTAWSGASPGALARGRAWLGVLTSVFLRPAGEGGLLTGLAAVRDPGGRGCPARRAALDRRPLPVAIVDRTRADRRDLLDGGRDGDGVAPARAGRARSARAGGRDGCPHASAAGLVEHRARRPARADRRRQPPRRPRRRGDRRRLAAAVHAAARPSSRS